MHALEGVILWAAKVVPRHWRSLLSTGKSLMQVRLSRLWGPKTRSTT
jgi:hypothetical protein